MLVDVLECDEPGLPDLSILTTPTEWWHQDGDGFTVYLISETSSF